MQVYIMLLIICLSAGVFTDAHAQRSTWKNPDQVTPEQNSPQTLEPVRVRSSIIIKGRLGLEVRRICQYKLAYEDKGSGGDQDVTFYNPVVPPDFYMIGAFAQGNYWNPADCVITVKPDNNPQSNQLLKPPANWQLVWTDKNSGARMNGSIWRPVAPDNDYICLGSVAKQGYANPDLPNYACVHRCLVETLPAANYLWSDKSTGARQNVSLYKLHNSNGFYAQPGYNRPAGVMDLKGNPVCEF